MVKNPNSPDRAGISATPAEENPSRYRASRLPNYLTTQLSRDAAALPVSYTAQ